MTPPSRTACVVLSLAVACLGACTQRTTGDPGAKTAKQLTGTDVASDALTMQYQQVKDTLEGMRKEGLTVPFSGPMVPIAITVEAGMADRTPCMEGYPCVIDLADCTATGSEYLGGDLEDADPGNLPAMADTAYEVIRLRSILGDAGFPTATWKPQLDRFEADALRTMATAKPQPQRTNEDEWSQFEPGPEVALQESLKSSLNAYRAAKAPALPEITIEGGCGAGDIGIHVATSPANGRSRFIPVFYHRLCRGQGKDPDDPAACDYWREPADGVLFDVAGDYQYRVDWPDGTKRLGKFSFTNLQDGQTVTISKP